jgi:hypothetical protein
MVRVTSPQATDTKDSEIRVSEFPSFVLFVTFVVQCLFHFFVALLQIGLAYF